jgi:hypothetical protein
VTEAKGKILWESPSIPSRLFEEPFGRHAIKSRKVAIEDDFGFPDSVDGQQVGGWCGHSGGVSRRLFELTAANQ